jgi:Zn-dependent protease with chaperone function
MESLVSSPLFAGLESLKQGAYEEAITYLEAFFQEHPDSQSQEYLQAYTSLIIAYQRSGNLEQAILLCQQLATSANLQAQTWAEQALKSLSREAKARQASEKPPSKAGRAAAGTVKLVMAGSAGQLALASGVTLSLLSGIVLALSLSLLLIWGEVDPATGLVGAVVATLIFNVATFFLAPLLMDLIQGWLYSTEWVSLEYLKQLSPEAAQVIKQICSEKNLKEPRLGIINDQNPTAFTYGSLPNQARLVVSRGIFSYLDEDEVATVYAHELGHIVHWDFAVMTLASTLVQITYLIYTFADRFSRRGSNNQLKDMVGNVALAAYVFYTIGTYLILYLSRTREYYADHFAAETTGNPNALSRALVKIAYGILEEGQRAEEPSRLIEGTRALGIYDPKAATSTGTAYRISTDAQKIGRVFLWDMFNPWAWWMELSSTHPLTGKRIRALSTYAEQLGLPLEFDMGRIIAEGNRLDKSKFYRNFLVDIVLYQAEFIVLGLGLLIGLISAVITGGGEEWKLLVAPTLIFMGVIILAKTLVIFPTAKHLRNSDILTVMSDPYASPLRGQAIQLQGQLIGRSQAGSKLGANLKLQDHTGMIDLVYASRLGRLGNAWFGLRKVEALIGTEVQTTGWFRRGIAPWVDLKQLTTSSGEKVQSHHCFWKLLQGIGIIILGCVMPSVLY